MVKSGQEAIRPVQFASTLHPNLPVEVIEYQSIIDRLGRDYLLRPDRPSFTMLMLVNSDGGSHQIDFEPFNLASGRLFRILPSQVLTWETDVVVDATLLISTAVLQPAPLWTPTSGPGRDLGRDSQAIARSLIDALRLEQHRFQAMNLPVGLW